MRSGAIGGVEPPSQRGAARPRDLTVGGHPVANPHFADEPERVAGPGALAVDGERARSRLDPPAPGVECRQRQSLVGSGEIEWMGSGVSQRIPRRSGDPPPSDLRAPARVPAPRQPRTARCRWRRPARAATGPARRSIASRARFPRSRPARSRRHRSLRGARSPGSFHRPAPARRPQSLCVPDQGHSCADDRTQSRARAPPRAPLDLVLLWSGYARGTRWASLSSHAGP